MEILFPKNNRIRKTEWIILLALTIVYFLLLFISYIWILGGKVEPFVLDLSVAKMIIALVSTLLVFSACDQFDDKPSTFLFNVVFFIIYIPMGIMYGCCNYETGFFLFVTALMYLSALCINGISIYLPKKKVVVVGMNRLIIWVAALIVGAVVFYSLFRFGFPSLSALNFSSVYNLRRHSQYQDNKYFGYIFRWTISVILPFLIVISMKRRNALTTPLLILIGVMFFLYSGSKTIIFSLPMTVFAFLFAEIKDMNHRFYSLFCVGMSGVIGLGILGWYDPYSYLVRRVLLIPANLKFLYYDFFSSRPKIGLAGTLWGSILNQKNPYSRGIGHEISSFYFKNDDMNSNTGFIAEGYYRFGFIGIIIAFALLILLLYLIDLLALRATFAVAVSVCIYPIYTLNDGAIIDSLIFGPFMVLLLIILFYSGESGELTDEGKIAIGLR